MSLTFGTPMIKREANVGDSIYAFPEICKTCQHYKLSLEPDVSPCMRCYRKDNATFPATKYREKFMWDCYNIDTGDKIGVSSVKPEKGEGHMFGDICYMCIVSGDIILFERVETFGEESKTNN